MTRRAAMCTSLRSIQEDRLGRVTLISGTQRRGKNCVAPRQQPKAHTKQPQTVDNRRLILMGVLRLHLAEPPDEHRHHPDCDLRVVLHLSREVPARHRQAFSVIDGADCRIARKALEQRHFPEEVSLPQGRQPLWIAAIRILHDLDLAPVDHEEPGRLIALLDNHLACAYLPRHHQLTQALEVTPTQLRKYRDILQNLFTAHLLVLPGTQLPALRMRKLISDFRRGVNNGALFCSGEARVFSCAARYSSNATTFCVSS